MKSIRFAWLVSLVATLGSLYFSEIKGFIPCELCWYQRILMYPLPIILGVAVWKNEKNIIPYVLPLPVIGILISGYHYLIQKVAFFSESYECKMGVPCNFDYINWLGFITIPLLAFTAFALIIGAFVYGLKKERPE